MQLIVKILPYVQVILSIVLVIAILLQQSGAGVGGALGGNDSSFHHTRRGLEKFLFYTSIVCGILFALTAFLAIVLKAKF
jgi:protein translocase SecG subunit